MSTVSEGLEVAGQESGASGEPDVNTQEGFDSFLAKQVGKEPSSEKAEPAESGQPYDPSQDTPEAIRAALADPDVAPSLRDGFTIHEPKPAEKPIPEWKRQIFDRNTAEVEKGVEECAAMGEELALRRFGDVWDSDAPDEDRLAAALTLREENPQVYKQFIQRLDEDAIDESAEYDPYGDLADEDLPGVQLDAMVEQAGHHLRAILAQEKLEKIQSHIAREKVAAIREVYAAQGVTEAHEIERRWPEDRAALAQYMRLDADALDPGALKEALGVLYAAKAEADEELRHDEIRAQILGAQTTSVSEGLERVNDWGELVPLTPRPSATRNLTPEQFEANVAKRLQQKSKGLTAKQAVREIVRPESNSVRDGLTQKGRPVSIDEASGSLREHEEQKRADRARTMSLLGR